MEKPGYNPAHQSADCMTDFVDLTIPDDAARPHVGLMLESTRHGLAVIVIVSDNSTSSNVVKNATAAAIRLGT